MAKKSSKSKGSKPKAWPKNPEGGNKKGGTRGKGSSKKMGGGRGCRG